MKVIAESFPGLIVCCSGCKAILAYKATDVYGNLIYCPLCKASTEVPLMKDYDGLVKEEKKDV